MEKKLLGDVAQIYMGLTFRRYIDKNAPNEKVIVYSSLKAYKGILNLQEETLSKDFCGDISTLVAIKFSSFSLK